MAAAELARHAAALRDLRSHREWRRNSRLLAPICDALDALLSAELMASGPAPGPAPEPDPAPAPAPAPEPEPDTDEDAQEIASDSTESVAPPPAAETVAVASWSASIGEAPPPAPKTETRAERLRAREKAVRRRLNSKGGEAEANGRVKRVLANTAGPAAVPGRVSSTSPEAVEAIREMGRSGVPPAVYVKLYV